jgi:hypothetical protein
MLTERARLDIRRSSWLGTVLGSSVTHGVIISDVRTYVAQLQET